MYNKGLRCYQSTVQTVCDQLEEGLAIGNMCHDLCQLDTIKPTECPAHHHGKEVVFRAEVGESYPVVVKARTLDIESESENIVFWTDEDGNVNYPSRDEFTKIMENHLSINFNFSFPAQKGLFALWPHSLEKDSLTQIQNDWLFQSSMKNIWSLSLDPEYVFSRIFKEFDVFPEIIGTCGGLNFVEEVKPLKMPAYMDNVSFEGWVERVKLALVMLDLLEELETMFDHPVHLCDIKPEHFGLSDHGRMKYLDVDNVYLKPIVDKSVGDGSYCESDSDCDLFDCQGVCNMQDKKCEGGVTNNNLQVVCQKIFTGDGKLPFNFLNYPGLLTSKHSSKGLQEIVELCANPSRSESESRVAADESIFNSLKKRLKEVVSLHYRIKNS